jgi:single-stranded DNA-binding protein
MQFLDSKNVDGGIPQEGGSSNYSATTTSTQDSASTQDPGNAQETPPDDGFIKDDIPF